MWMFGGMDLVWAKKALGIQEAASKATDMRVSLEDDPPTTF